jgi:hypothetical protein
MIHSNIEINLLRAKMGLEIALQRKSLIKNKNTNQVFPFYVDDQEVAQAIIASTGMCVCFVAAAFEEMFNLLIASNNSGDLNAAAKKIRFNKNAEKIEEFIAVIPNYGNLKNRIEDIFKHRNEIMHGKPTVENSLDEDGLPVYVTLRTGAMKNQYGYCTIEYAEECFELAESVLEYFKTQVDD